MLEVSNVASPSQVVEVSNVTSTGQVVELSNKTSQARTTNPQLHPLRRNDVQQA
jgi:hypothetical protein